MTLQTSALRACTCGASHDIDDHRYIGGQATGVGSVLLLANAPCCGTTYTLGELVDAAICEGCQHVVVGDVEDPKTIGLGFILCLDCANDDQRVPHHFHGFGRRRRTRAA